MRIPSNYFNDIIESLDDCLILTDTAGVIQYANKAASEIFGMSQKKLDGQNIREVLDIKTSSAESLTLAEVADFFSNIERTVDVSGQERSVFLFSAALIEGKAGRDDRFVFTGKNITYIRDLKNELVMSRENVYFIVLKSPDGLLIVDVGGKVLFNNPAAEKMLRRKAEELYGMAFGLPVIPGDMAEIDIVRPDGAKGIAEMRSIETRWQGTPSYLISIRDVTENVMMREELRNMSLRDDLTGLYNRRGFFAVAEQYMRTAMRMRVKIVLLFIDLNDFKDINDRYGHSTGDIALKETAKILKKTFRDSDIVARMGGDEFIVLGMEDISSDSQHTASRLVGNLDEFNKSRVLPYDISLSIGLAYCDYKHPQTIDDLIVIADKLMYEDKANKKARLM